MEKQIRKIIKEANSYEDIWFEVVEQFGQNGLTTLETIAAEEGWLDDLLNEMEDEY